MRPFQSTSDSLSCERLVISPSTRSDMASTSFCSCSALASSSEEGGDDVEVEVVEDEDGGPIRTRMRFLVVAEIPNFLSASLIWGYSANRRIGADCQYLQRFLICFDIKKKVDASLLQTDGARAKPRYVTSLSSTIPNWQLATQSRSQSRAVPDPRSVPGQDISPFHQPFSKCYVSGP